MPRLSKASRIACVLMFCAVASVCLAAPQRQSRQKAPAKAPAADPSLIDAQGFRELLERHRGKPLLVNFWATWCPPCHEEYPMVNELARQYVPRGLVVLGISLDEDAEINLVRRFLARHKPVFPNYREKPGDQVAFARAVSPKWKGTIPATFFYSRDGREVARRLGGSREEFERIIQAMIETARSSSLSSERTTRSSNR